MKIDSKLVGVAFASLVFGYAMGRMESEQRLNFKMQELENDYEKLLTIVRVERDKLAEQAAKAKEDEAALLEAADQLAVPYSGEPDDVTPVGTGQVVEEAPQAVNYASFYPAAQGSNVRLLRPVTPDTGDAGERKEDEPYVISQETFMLNETGYDQYQYTYYAGDDILTNDSDEVIDAHERKIQVGDALTRFGEQSGEATIVFVRSDWLRQDVEIARDERTFAEVVQGEGDGGP
jgi:hypothetical protein